MEVPETEELARRVVLGLKSDGNDEPLRVEPRELLYHTLVVGQSGSGKSYFIARLVEEILLKTHARVVVLDPNGDFRRLHIPSSTVWDEFGSTFRRIKDSLSEEDCPELEAKTDFTSQWHLKRFQYLIAEDDLVTGSSIRAVNTDRLVIHWDSVPREREFLLGLGPRESAGAWLALRACEQHVEREMADFTIDSLVDVAAGFEAGNVSMAHYPFARNLGGDVWLQVGAYLRELRSRYQLWWNVKGTLPRPTGLNDYLSRPFAKDTRHDTDHWNALMLTLDAAEKPDVLLAANVTLAELWRSAKGAWLDTIHASGEPDGNDFRVPTFIVIDEAHNFCPGEPSSGLQARVTDRLLQIASEGRKYGLYLILATQRPTKLHKGLVPECENSAVLRLQSPIEHDYASDVLGISPDVRSRISKFRRGQGLIAGRWQSPQEVVNFAPARSTVGGGSLPPAWQLRTCLSVKALAASDLPDLKKRAGEIVVQCLSDSAEPVTLVGLANRLRRDMGPMITESNWLGYTRFKPMLENLGIPNLTVSGHAPGWAHLSRVDTERALSGSVDVDAAVPASLLRVHDAAGVPRLNQREYAFVFSQLSAAVERGAVSLSATSKEVRDRGVEQGIRLARSDIGFVIKGLMLSGHRFGDDLLPQDAEYLGSTFAANVLFLADKAQLELSESDVNEIVEWIVGSREQST